MRNLAEPGSRFRAAAPNHPEALLEEPQGFQAVEEQIAHVKTPTAIVNLSTFKPLQGSAL